MMKRFISWEKVILIYSTILATILTAVGIVLFPLLGPVINMDVPPLSETLKLGISGWAGFVGVGSIINISRVLLRLFSNRT